MEDLSAIRTLEYVALEPLKLAFWQLRPETLLSTRGTLLQPQVVSDEEAVLNSQQHRIVHNAIVGEHLSIALDLLVKHSDLVYRKVDLLMLPGAVEEVNVFEGRRGFGG